jgi:hypothetical protein
MHDRPVDVEPLQLAGDVGQRVLLLGVQDELLPVPPGILYPGDVVLVRTRDGSRGSYRAGVPENEFGVGKFIDSGRRFFRQEAFRTDRDFFRVLENDHFDRVTRVLRDLGFRNGLGHRSRPCQYHGDGCRHSSYHQASNLPTFS